MTISALVYYNGGMEQENTTLEETARSEDGAAAQRGGARRRYIADICYIGLFAALLAVCSWLYVPMTSGISITLQTMGVCLAAGFLGWKRGTVCVIAYILLGVCGVPVFSEFKNFYALIYAPSAGYVIGFIFTALIVGAVSDLLPRLGERVTHKVKSRLLQLAALAVAMAVGVAVCYVFGTLWFMLVYKGSVTADNLQTALLFCVYPYILPDLIKIAAAAVLVNRLKGHVKLV